jgi:predicted enzyme related to lactoylglutathione lyase
MQLNTARVFVKDMEAAKAFYENAMGLSLKADGFDHGYFVFQAGAADLVVERVADDAPDEDQQLVGRFTGLSFTVADVQATHDQLVSRGVRFTGLPERQAWGGVLATLQDCDGNELQVVQYPVA